MARYDANVSMLFTDLPYLRRFEAAASAGFEAVEFLWPSAEQLEGRSVEQLGALIRSTGLHVPLFNFDAGDLSAGWRGLAGVPEARASFRANLPVAIGLAIELGCRKLNALAGNAASVGTRETQLEVLVEGLAEAAEMAAPAGICVMLEALNPVDFPSYLVLDSATALDVVTRTGRPNVRYQLDVYHAAAGGEDPIAVARAAAGRIGHVQFADFPGRHEPGTGVLDWSAILHALDEAGYDDWIGLEYRPTDGAYRDFRFLEAIGSRPAD
jgi:hydroxypyruvate isomerase